MLTLVMVVSCRLRSSE